MWNPIASRDPVVVPVPSSEGAATVTLRPWTARERLAYEDAMLVRAYTKTEEDTDTVRLGMLRLLHLSLTIVGSSGFPDGFDVSGTDPRTREASLLSLSDEVFEELSRLAAEVQPVPGSEEETKRRKASELPDPDGDAEDGGDEDPPTVPEPSTPPDVSVPDVTGSDEPPTPSPGDSQ